MRGVLSSCEISYDQLHMEWLGFMKAIVQGWFISFQIKLWARKGNKKVSFLSSALFGMKGSTGFHKVKTNRMANRAIVASVMNVRYVRGYRTLIDPKKTKRSIAGNEYFSVSAICDRYTGL